MLSQVSVCPLGKGVGYLWFQVPSRCLVKCPGGGGGARVSRGRVGHLGTGIHRVSKGRVGYLGVGYTPGSGCHCRSLMHPTGMLSCSDFISGDRQRQHNGAFFARPILFIQRNLTTKGRWPSNNVAEITGYKSDTTKRAVNAE